MKDHAVKIILLGTAIVLLFAVIGVGSFNHQNPLTAKTNDAALNKAATFLYNTAKASEPEVTKQFHLSYRRGDLYSSCMNGEESNSKVCAALYQLMKNYAGAHASSLYHKVNVSDIQDRQMWESLKDNYYDVQFNDF